MNSITAAVLGGINLILKYEPDAKIGAEWEEIFFGRYETRNKMTPEEQAQMEQWGWVQQGLCWSIDVSVTIPSSPET